MMTMFRHRKGFSLIEIIIAAIIITLAAAGAYSAFIYARFFSNKFQYRSMATRHAQQIVEELRFRHGYDEDDTGEALEVGTNFTTAGPDPASLLDVTTWELDDRVDSLTAAYGVEDVWFVNGIEQTADPGNGWLPMKKITVRITWDERTGV